MALQQLRVLQYFVPINTCMHDRMDTDIVAGIECGLDTVLVLSGVTDRSMIDHFPYRPRLVLQGVGDIPDAAEEGIVHLESAVG